MSWTCPMSLPSARSEIGIRSYAEIVLACLLWGSQHPFLRKLSVEMPPLYVNTIRFSIAIICLFPFVLARRKLVARSELARIAGLGAIGVGLFSSIVIEGVRRSTAVHLSLFTNIHPFLTALLAPLLIGEAWRSEKLLASAIGFFGIALI